MKKIKSNDELLDVLISIKNELDEDKILFVSVAGLSRSGKSTLIHEIQKQLSEKFISSISIPLDHWILPASNRDNAMTVKERYQYDQIFNDINKLVHKKEIEINPYDPMTREISKNKIKLSISGKHLVFFDGVIALDHSYINNISRLKIFIEIDEKKRKKRFVDFYKSKGLSKLTIRNLYTQRMIDEFSLVKKSKNNADILIVEK
jgi:uridine kinase